MCDVIIGLHIIHKKDVDVIIFVFTYACYNSLALSIFRKKRKRDSIESKTCLHEIGEINLDLGWILRCVIVLNDRLSPLDLEIEK